MGSAFDIERDPTGRGADLDEIRAALKTETNPRRRKKLKALASKISHEPRKVRHMRHELIRRTREGTSEDVRDVRDSIEGDHSYE